MKPSITPATALFGKTLVLAGLIAAWAVSLPAAAQEGPVSEELEGTFSEPASRARPPQRVPAPGQERAKIPERFSEMFEAGGPLMWPIALCSVIVVAFSLERLVVLRRRRVIPRDFVKRFLEHLESGQLDRTTALALCEQNGSPIAQVFAHGVRKWGKPSVEVEQAIIDGGERQVGQLRRNLRILNTITTVSPLLGLLGTVQGMIKSFNGMAMGVGAGKVAEKLAQGIGMALIATAGGLIVAIPALVLYMYFAGRVDGLVMEMDSLAQKVVSLISAEGLQTSDLPRIAPRPKTMGTSALKNS